MFSGKRRKDKGNKEKKAGRRKKAIAFAAAFAAAGAGVASYYLSPRDGWQAEKRHNEYVARELAIYDDYSAADRPSDVRVALGSEGSIIKDSVVILGTQSDKKNITVQGLKRFINLDVDEGLDIYDKRPFIRPVDGGQDILLDSSVKIDGLDYDDLEGILSSRAVVKIIPKIPEILQSYFSIDSIAINGRGIPLKYVRAADHSDKMESPQYVFDLRKLVEDGVLLEDDFKSGLEIRIQSFVEIDEIPTIYEDEVAGLFAYKAMPGKFRKYTESTDELPSGNEVIKKMVGAYEGDTYNVLDIIKYALDETNDALEYEVKNDGQDLEDILKSGKGDCEYYSMLFTTILRAFGVPARTVEGTLEKYDSFEFDGRHVWTEVLLPFKDGSYRWIHVEPTWADHDHDPYRFINFVDHRYLYTFDMDVELETSDYSDKFYVFQHHKWLSVYPDELDGEIEEGDEK